MKSTSDRRQMVKWTKQQIRKADRRKVKYQSFKQNDRDRAIISTLASPCSKAPLSPVEGSAKCVRKIFIQINELIEGRAFRSEQLFEVVDVLKSLFSKANEEENGPAATELYQHITAKECSTLSRLMSPDVCERTQVKTMGIFLELSYSPFAHLILHSPQALEKIVLTLSAKNKALRVRAVGCIANLVEDGKERDFLVGIPEVITGLIQNLDFVYEIDEDIGFVIIARDTCWAINNIFSADPATDFAVMQPFLNPLVNALVLVERLWLMDNEHAINLIRFGLRALENALDTARNANTECSLHNDPKLVHFLSWCMRYRHNAKTRDIPVSALNCMRHFALTLFLEEIFVTDIPRILKEERQLGVDAQLFLTSWCSTLACMIENNGISDQMMTRTVSRMANGLFMLTGEKWRCSDRGLRRSACHALTVLGCSLRGGPYMDAFWVAGGGNGLLVALSLDMEAAVNHQALLALKNLLPAIPAEASKFLVFQPKLRGDLKEAAEKYLYSQDDATSQVADAVMKKLDILEDAENEMSNLAHQSNNLKADQAPATKRRRVELGAFNS